MYIEHGTNPTTLSAGELMIISPKVMHKGYTLDSDVEYDVLMFDVRSFYNDTEICKNLLPAIFEGRAVFKSVTSNPETVACMDSICSDSEKESLDITSKIYKLLALFYKNELVELHKNQKNIFIKEIVEYLEENSAQEINIDTLCKKFGYTSAHLCRKFKQATGLPPMTYLKIYRLEQAHKKLKNRNSSVSLIASECGFSDANYFTRCFKAHFGVTPLEYSKNQY